MKITQNKTPEAELHALYDEFHKLPIQYNKIVCSNFHGQGYGCNPKYIVEALLQHKKKLDIVWLVKGKNNEFPEGIRTVPFHSVDAVKEIATARVLIDNQMKFTGFKKRPDQFFIETWHGEIPLKKIGFDNPQNHGKTAYAKRVAINFKSIDLVTTNSQFGSEVFRRAFQYKGNIFDCGLPRNGVLFHTPSILRQKICQLYHIDSDKKIVIYAPTFRSQKDMSPYTLDYDQVLDSLGEGYVMLIRLHPHLQGKADVLTYTDRIINASAYPDSNELMAVSDIMITDYSSVMFNFAMTGRPVYLFASDVEEYRKQRDYYFDIYDLPFPLSTTTEELVQNMLFMDEDVYKRKVARFWDEICLHETGDAAQRIAALIIKMTKKRDLDLAAEVRKISEEGGNFCATGKKESILQAFMRKIAPKNR